MRLCFVSYRWELGTIFGFDNAEVSLTAPIFGFDDINEIQWNIAKEYSFTKVTILNWQWFDQK